MSSYLSLQFKYNDIHIFICRGNDVTTFESRDKFPWFYHFIETSQGVLYAWHFNIYILSRILLNVYIGRGL